jgi:hypothetical protein
MQPDSSYEADTLTGFDWDNAVVKQVCERYIVLNRKCLPSDAEQSHKVRDTALYYAETYQGAFNFMLDMQRRVAQFKKLPLACVPGVINCMMHEYKQRKAQSIIVRTFNEDGTPAYDTTIKPRVETLPDLPAEIAAHKAAENEASLNRLAASDNLLAHTLVATVRAQEAQSTTQAAPTVSIKEVPIKSTCGLCGVSSAVSYDASLQPSCIDQAACMARRNTPVTPACKSGTYTIVLDEIGNYRTLKLSDVPAEKCVNGTPVGTQYVGYLKGANNETDYQPMGYICGTELRIKTIYRKDSNIVKALTVLLSADKETQHDMGHAYAIESNRCWRCNRTLTVPNSIHRGLGPECAKKV